ncbi:MAG: class I SAM-dependent methyltransferase [Gracilibacteraceae bacterium]|nr:class I SAM-dependent methyltransferase [Gracilibacteraceae bacterium]
MGITQKLIEQCKTPRGLLGRIMLRIMNGAHRGLTVWGLAKVPPCSKVLDVGCGGGAALSLMAETDRFEHIYGIDISPDAVSLATAKNRRHIETGLVTIMQGSVLELPFDDNTFDAATTFQSHYHWPDIITAIQEIYRVLKPGGQFVLVAEIYKIKYHMQEYNNTEQTKILFEDGGFSSVDLSTYQKSIRVAGNKVTPC